MTRRARSLIKLQLGRVLSWLRPDIVRKLEASTETWRPAAWSASRVERLIREALIAKHIADRDEEALTQSHKKFWTGDRAVEFHATVRGREQSFLGEHYVLVEELERVLAGGRYERLYEIGCGSGFVANHLAERMTMLKDVVGVDLSPKQVAINRQSYSNSRLSFVAADATIWIPENAAPETAFVAYGGVLEYFSQPILEEMLRRIAAHPPVCFALMEPIAPDYDLSRETQSRLFGNEMTLSHNYPHLFAEAGFRVHWQKDLPRARYLMMIAVKDSA